MRMADDWRDQTTITVEKAAEILSIGRASGYRAAKTGELPTVKFGRRLLVPTAKLKALLGETASPPYPR